MPFDDATRRGSGGALPYRDSSFRDNATLRVPPQDEDELVAATPLYEQ
jgi:hypothetical protein